MSQKNSIQHLFAMIRARYGAVAVTTSEEQRFIRVLHQTMTKTDYPNRPTVIKTWSATEGLQVFGKVPASGVEEKVAPDAGTLDLKKALSKVMEEPRESGVIFVFKDVHLHLAEKGQKGTLEIIRYLRDCAQALRERYNTLLLLSPSFAVPPELEKELTVFDFPLPTEQEMRAVVQSAYTGWKDGFGEEGSDKFSQEGVSELARACMGMTELEAEDALTLGMYEQNGWGKKLIPNIHEAKQASIRRVGCLEAIPVTSGMESVGGLDVLKKWVTTRKEVFTDKAREFGAEAPKGLMTLGVPGGGKSLSARAVASSWNIPLIRMDMGAVMGMWLGESEGNLRRALKVAEALAPCVLWVDEIEKGLAGTSPGGGGHETTSRVLGNLLTWMQEKEAPVILYFTANDVNMLPAPLLRKGRIDELFFVDLPGIDDRKEILAIHLKKRNRDPKNFDLDKLAEACKSFVGAEIEQGIKEAIIDAFSEGASEVTEDHIIAAFDRTTPIVKVQPEQMQQLLDFVKRTGVVRASTDWERYEITDESTVRPEKTGERKSQAKKEPPGSSARKGSLESVRAEMEDAGEIDAFSTLPATLAKPEPLKPVGKRGPSVF